MTEAYSKNSLTVPAKSAYQCFCIGPRNGQPLCPCRMRNVEVRNGRYVEVIDHGPVPEEDNAEIARRWDATMQRFLG